MNDNLKNSVNIIGKELVKEIISNLIKLDKKASGKLIKSLDYHMIETIDGLLLEIVSVDYLKWVDSGRGPGKPPPMKDIQKWITDKKIKHTGLSIEELSFLISRSIGKNGIPATNILQKSFDSIYNSIDQLIDQGIGDDIDKILSDI